MSRFRRILVCAVDNETLTDFVNLKDQIGSVFFRGAHRLGSVYCFLKKSYLKWCKSTRSTLIPFLPCNGDVRRRQKQSAAGEPFPSAATLSFSRTDDAFCLMQRFVLSLVAFLTATVVRMQVWSALWRTTPPGAETRAGRTTKEEIANERRSPILASERDGMESSLF
jgi:hypothetical protein